MKKPDETAEAVRRRNQLKVGRWSEPLATATAFLEESIVRRELADEPAGEERRQPGAVAGQRAHGVGGEGGGHDLASEEGHGAHSRTRPRASWQECAKSRHVQN